MKTQQFKGNAWCCGMAAFAMALIMLLFLMACQSDEPKKQYLHHVSLTHPDGTVENWVLRGGFEMDEGFLSWTDGTGGKMRISGSIKITPVVIQPPPKIKPEPEIQDEDMP